MTCSSFTLDPATHVSVMPPVDRLERRAASRAQARHVRHTLGTWGGPMDDILEQAREYRQTVATRAAAHDESAEYHRHVGQVLGLAATILSAVAGSAVVVV